MAATNGRLAIPALAGLLVACRHECDSYYKSATFLMISFFFVKYAIEHNGIAFFALHRV